VALLDCDDGGAEALAAVLSDGSLAFARAVEADAWEETLEEQRAWQLQRGGGGAATGGEQQQGAAASAAAAGPRPGARAASGAAAAQQHQGQRQRVAAAWDEQHVLLPLGTFAASGAAAVGGAAAAGVPLAEGRRVKGAAWLSPGRLLLVAAPHPEPDAEGGVGDVLVEVAVRLPEPLLSAAEGSAPEAAGEVEVTEVGCSYAGGPVLAAAPLPPARAAAPGAYETAAAAAADAGASSSGGDPGDASGALLQLASGALLQCDPGGSAPRPLGPGASFPVPCPLMAPLPAGSGAGAVGLAPNGVLYWGPRAVAGGVTSFALRWGGAGGGALLYTTRASILYVVMLSQLAGYAHKEVGSRPQAVGCGCQRAGGQADGAFYITFPA
jgi:hypothetical protein